MSGAIEKSRLYLRAVIDWFLSAYQKWIVNPGLLEIGQLEQRRPLPWGEKVPLFEIVSLIAHNPADHDGELNQILSIRRGEVWEAVEGDNINTRGQHVNLLWLEVISH